MFKILIIIFLISMQVTDLANLNKAKLLQTYGKCILKLHIDMEIASTLINLNSTLPEHIPEMIEVAECEIKEMDVLNSNGTLAVNKFKKLFYTILDYNPKNPLTRSTTQMIEKGFKTCGVRRGIKINGQIAIKLYNCLIRHIRGKTGEIIQKKDNNKSKKL